MFCRTQFVRISQSFKEIKKEKRNYGVLTPQRCIRRRITITITNFFNFSTYLSFWLEWLGYCSSTFDKNVIDFKYSAPVTKFIYKMNVEKKSDSCTCNQKKK